MAHRHTRRHRHYRPDDDYFSGPIRFWLPIVTFVVVLEIGILGFLLGYLESCCSHHAHPWGGMSSSWRRKYLRLTDSHWRQKSKPDLLRQARALEKVHPFHLDYTNEHHEPHEPHPGRESIGMMGLADPDLDQESEHGLPLAHQHQHHDTDDKPLDDFYSRPHSQGDGNPPFLIVGGSDGSGTRLFVNLLRDLGVPMVVDSWDTMDVTAEDIDVQGIHGKQEHGWPPLVRLVLQSTHRAANYTLHDLPRPVQEKVVAALVQLKSSLLQKASRVRRDRNPLSTPLAAGVEGGFKAPVAIVLLPLLRHVFGPIKVLHIVRDGRDVALSDNQSPVAKFYQAFYGQSLSQPRLHHADIELSSMRLWADWNMQVYNWEKEQVQQQQLANTNLPQFDFMVMRTEDLLHPETRLEAMVQLAAFVGARVTPKDLCCKSRQHLMDMGQSNHKEESNKYRFAQLLAGVAKKAPAEEEKFIQARYGKWRKLLRYNPELLAQLQQIGNATLEAFGYEPPRRFLDRQEALNCDEILRDNQRCSDL
jgi:hypothetical protein